MYVCAHLNLCACLPVYVCVRVHGSVDRIQQLRREYQQARREGMVPPYEELDLRRRVQENDAHRVRSSDTLYTLTTPDLRPQQRRKMQLRT